MTEENSGKGGLDWEAARRRLARLASEATSALSPEEEAARLEARARALARPASQASPEALLELVRLRVGEQDYALETRFALEVLRDPELVPLPGAPPLLRGLTLLRGETLAVVELAPLFGRPASASRGPVLVVGSGRPELGLRTDSVEEVLLLSRSALLPPPPTLAAQERALVAGVGRDGLLLLEGEALLGDSRLLFDLSEERTS
jgi:purine-binding chemotaxis protein CheW